MGGTNAAYAGTSPPYRFSSIHATNPGLCAQNDPVKADWVHKLGQWIDTTWCAPPPGASRPSCSSAWE
jgi:hypothetical protein